MMQLALFVFMALAASGFVLSIAAHVTALLGLVPPIGQAVWLLHIGIIVVWMPTVFLTRRVARGERRQDVRKVLWSGCPRWMQRMWFVLVPYVVLNFVYFIATSADHRHRSNVIDAATLRGFSGHWMIFYGAAFMTLYSVRHRPELLRPRTCPHGHAVSHGEQFCPSCGWAL